MAGTTPKLALRYPSSTDADNVPTDMQNLATDIETALGKRGLFANLPAAGHEGRYYATSDTNQVFRDNGTTWDELLFKAAANAAYGASAWTAYTPTTGGLTLGNGTVTGAYSLVGKTLRLRIVLTWGSTSGTGGEWTFSLPASLVAQGAQTGPALYRKVAGTAYRGLLWLPDGTTSLYAFFVDGGFDASTLPVAPGTGDAFVFTASIEVR